MVCIKNLILVLLLVLGVTSQVVGQVVDPQNIVIKNVYIATDVADDGQVNLLIRDNKLELVSPDQISVPDGYIALDAGGGYLIGNLALGESPSLTVVKSGICDSVFSGPSIILTGRGVTPLSWQRMRLTSVSRLKTRITSRHWTIASTSPYMKA